MITSQKISSVLANLAEVIRRGDSATFDRVLEALAGAGDAFGKPKPVAARRRPSGAQKIDRKKISEIHRALDGASSRAEGVALLGEASLSRTELVALAKAGSVHVTKDDGIEFIEEKLVESLIGSKLSSAAIRRTT